jgi:TRAP-type C4-dicarboxylate transport system permease small subunit
MDWDKLQQTALAWQRRLQQAALTAWQSAQRRAVPAWHAVRRRGADAGTALRQRLPDHLFADTAPAGARRVLETWHRAECWVAVVAFGFIAGILLLDVIGREFVGPLLRLVGLEPGATGIFAAQKLSVFALVIGSFAGIGIATAAGSHIVPRVAYGWVPASWGPAMDRTADIVTGLFLVGVAWFGFKFVASSYSTGLRAPVLDWPVWPIQLFIPLGFLSAAGRYFLFALWPPLKPPAPEFQE